MFSIALVACRSVAGNVLAPISYVGIHTLFLLFT
jgi:hypothetical protein